MSEPLAPAEWLLIPEGEYVFGVERAESGVGWEDRRTNQRRRVLYVHGRVLEGQHVNVRLFMPLPIIARQSSVFYEAWTVAMQRKPVRGERMKFSAFAGKAFLSSVVTVKRNNLGRLRAPVAWYSKVAALLQLVGTLDVWSLLETGDRKPNTSNLIPPTPVGFSEEFKASDTVLASASGRIGVGSLERGG
jgi:hypothetical protein